MSDYKEWANKNLSVFTGIKPKYIPKKNQCTRAKTNQPTKSSDMIKHLEIIEILEAMQVNEASLVAVLVACAYEATIYVKTDTPTADLLRRKYTFEADPESKIERAEITAHHLNGNSYTFLLRIL